MSSKYRKLICTLRLRHESLLIQRNFLLKKYCEKAIVKAGLIGSFSYVVADLRSTFGAEFPLSPRERLQKVDKLHAFTRHDNTAVITFSLTKPISLNC